MNSIITGTGTYIPSITKENIQFSGNRFLHVDGTPFKNNNELRPMDGSSMKTYFFPYITLSYSPKW